MTPPASDHEHHHRVTLCRSGRDLDQREIDMTTITITSDPEMTQGTGLRAMRRPVHATPTELGRGV